MTRTRILVVLSFVIAFAAGLTLGAALAGSTQPHGHPPAPGGLSAQLDLTADQQMKMGEIWSSTMQNWERTYRDRRHALSAERDQLLQELFTPVQQVQYDVIIQEYETALSELAQEGGKAREEANKRTMEILTVPQRKKFEDIQRQWAEHGWGHRGQKPEQGPAAATPGTTGD